MLKACTAKVAVGSLCAWPVFRSKRHPIHGDVATPYSYGSESSAQRRSESFFRRDECCFDAIFSSHRRQYSTSAVVLSYINTIPRKSSRTHLFPIPAKPYHRE